MGFWNTVRMALRSLGKNRLRAGLTTLGVVIGIAAVTAMVSISQEHTGLVQRELEGLGTNVIIIMPKMMDRGPVQIGIRLPDSRRCRGDGIRVPIRRGQ